MVQQFLMMGNCCGAWPGPASRGFLDGADQFMDNVCLPCQDKPEAPPEEGRIAFHWDYHTLACEDAIYSWRKGNQWIGPGNWRQCDVDANNIRAGCCGDGTPVCKDEDDLINAEWGVSCASAAG